MATNETQERATQEKFTQAQPKREINWSNIGILLCAIVCVVAFVGLPLWTAYKWLTENTVPTFDVPTNTTVATAIQPVTNLIQVMIPLIFVLIVLSTILSFVKGSYDDEED